jgi:hypothetical protein
MIVLYKGRRGSGKTLTMIKDGFRYYKNGYKILRNFTCSFGKYISDEQILNLNKDSNIKNCVLMMDEVQIFFDARRSMRKQNLQFSNFVQQIRKRNIILLGTAQYANTVDLRFRQHVDIVAYPNFYKKLNVCEVIYVDMTSVEDNILGQIKTPHHIKIVYNPIPLFNLYKTEEMIK